MNRTYKSKIGSSFWSHLILILVIAVPVIILMRSATYAAILFSILFFAIILYFVLLALRTRYIFDDYKLTIRNIIGKKEIPYETVKKVVGSSKDPFNYGIVVLSMDRIEIFHGKNGYTLISPKDKKEVLRLLRQNCYNADHF
jgi:Protein of unknown function (DUF1200).